MKSNNFHIIVCILVISTLFASTVSTSQASALESRKDSKILPQTAYDCSAQGEISQRECEALVALYNHTNGNTWWHNSNWLMTYSPCSWLGVGCDFGKVTYLSLSRNNLIGIIPAEMGNLTNLVILDLRDNQLTGSIPAELGNLANLQGLTLDYNQLTSIPAELGNLANLVILCLTNNQLTSIPAELGNLANIKELRLDYNQLTSIPAELGNLTNLEYLTLYDNQLTSIPAELGNLAKLYFLDLSINKLTSLPAELGNLANPNLWALNLRWNQLTRIPAELGNLTGLKALTIDNNQLTSIPAELGNLANLEGLTLDYNQLTSIPAELGNLANLKELRLDYNQLTSIPAELGNLANLEFLYVGNNKLTGSIPPELGNLKLLKKLHLQRNQLTNGIPSEVGSMTNLEVLWVYGNQLTGNIPITFTNLKNLHTFYFHETTLCEPNNADFITWKATVGSWNSTGIICEEPSLAAVDLDASSAAIAVATYVHQYKNVQPITTGLEVTVKNLGQNAASDVTVELYNGTPAASNRVATGMVATISANSTGKALINLDALSSPLSMNLYVKAITGPSNQESNLANNTSSSATPFFIAYADTAGGQPYRYDPDTYHFPNNAMTFNSFLEGWMIYQSELDPSALDPGFWQYLVGPALYAVTASGGHCYGMASTSIAYAEKPSIKPVQGAVYSYEPTNPDVTIQIRDHHIRQIIQNTSIGFLEPLQLGLFDFGLFSPTKAYDSIKARLQKDNAVPSILSYRYDVGDNNYGHAVVAYKIVEVGNQKVIYEYDNNRPYGVDFPNAEFIVFNSKDNTLNFPNLRSNYATASDPIYSFGEITTDMLNSIIQKMIRAAIDNLMLQVFYSWEPQPQQSNRLAANGLAQAPTTFLITNRQGQRIGFVSGTMVNEIAGAQLQDFGTGYYLTLPANDVYTLQTIGNGSVKNVLSLLEPLYQITAREVLYEGFAIPLGKTASLAFGKEVPVQPIQIEGGASIPPTITQLDQLDSGSVYIPMVGKSP